MPASYDPYEAYEPNGLQHKMALQLMSSMVEDGYYIPTIQFDEEAVVFEIGPTLSYSATITLCWLDYEDPDAFDLLGKPLPQLLEVGYQLRQTAYWPAETRDFLILDISYLMMDGDQESSGNLTVHHYAKPTFVLFEEDKRKGYEGHLGPSSLYLGLHALNRALGEALLRDENLARIIVGLEEWPDSVVCFYPTYNGPDAWEYSDPESAET